MQKGLILIAHGSRNEESNAEIACLTARLQTLLQHKYALINYAFLEFAQPNIAEAIQNQIQQKMQEIVLFPYFLSSGNHVVKDIPTAIASFQRDFSEITFTIMPPFGSYANMSQLLAELL